jgi:hypothetical protein
MTRQAPEYLTWDGSEYPIRDEPLAPYLTMTDIDLVPRGVLNSACWRGYQASWEVGDDRLYLVRIEGISESHPLLLADLFPGFGQRVFAHWFTGTIAFAMDHRPIQLPGRRPLPYSFWVREGQVVEPQGGGNGGYRAASLDRRYEDYAPAVSSLLEQIAIPDIEGDEMVSDPLGAVPPTPFGHMNWKWAEFRDALPPGAALWRFSYQRLGQIYGGYASVARDRIDRFVLTSIREIDE